MLLPLDISLPGRSSRGMVAQSPRHTIPAQRRQETLRAVRSGATHVADLAVNFGVSQMTVGCDLRELARECKLEAAVLPRPRGRPSKTPGSR